MNYVYVVQNSPRLPLSCLIIRIYHIYYIESSCLDSESSAFYSFIKLQRQNLKDFF